MTGESSPWSSIGRGVPQGSVLGPTFFMIHIKGTDIWLYNLVSNPSDDTKIGSAILSDENRLLQDN